MNRPRQLVRGLLAAALSVSALITVADPASATPNSTDVATAVAQAHAEPQLRAATERTLAQQPQLVQYSDAGLNERVIRRYGSYVRNTSAGEYTVNLPLLDRWFDPQGTAAVSRAVDATNRTVRSQLSLLESKGVTTQGYRYGNPLPMGPHATFTPLWWGMVFTLDATAAATVNQALGDITTGVELVDLVLGSLGAIIAPAVKAAFAVVLKVMKWVVSYVKGCTTKDGLVFKSLWAPIVWCERPTGPFRPAA